MFFLIDNLQPSLTENEKKEIDKYWSQFGIKWPDYSWYQMYYGVTGIHSPRFIPDPFVGFAIIPYYNNPSYINGWEDKNLFDRILPDILQPETLCHHFKGVYYDENWKPYNEEDLLSLAIHIYERIRDDKKFFLKYTIKSYAGKGVKVKNILSTDDILTVFSEERNTDYIIQRKIQQHFWMEQFNKSSVNIFRVNTWKHKGKVTVLSTTVRYGIEGSFTDVSYVNGVEIVNVAGVDSKGRLNGHFANLNGIAKRPSQVIDYAIPNYEKILEFVKHAHLQLQPFDYIGWDITLNQKCQPLCIEYNLTWPGSILYQYVQGPLAGDLTEDFLAFLKNEFIRNHYIPKKYLLCN